MGGLFVSLVGRRDFLTGYTEWTIALLGGCVTGRRDHRRHRSRTVLCGNIRGYSCPALSSLPAGSIAAAVSEFSVRKSQHDRIATKLLWRRKRRRRRSLDVNGEPESTVLMVNGRTEHGMQFQDESLRDDYRRRTTAMIAASVWRLTSSSIATRAIAASASERSASEPALWPPMPRRIDQIHVLRNQSASAGKWRTNISRFCGDAGRSMSRLALAGSISSWATRDCRWNAN